MSPSHRLKVFTIDFKDSLQATPSVGYSSYNIPRQISRPCFQSLCHVQFGQMVQNSVISVVLQNCPQLRNFHANNCPDLHDTDLVSPLWKQTVHTYFSTGSSATHWGCQCQAEAAVSLHLRGSTSHSPVIQHHPGLVSQPQTVWQPLQVSSNTMRNAKFDFSRFNIVTNFTT